MARGVSANQCGEPGPEGTVVQEICLDSGVGEYADTDETGSVDQWRRKSRSLPLISPLPVEGGPILENVMEEGEVDISFFPAPLWHKLDGGRYLGTVGPTVTRDPDGGERVNNLG